MIKIRYNIIILLFLFINIIMKLVGINYFNFIFKNFIGYLTIFIWIIILISKINISNEFIILLTKNILQEIKSFIKIEKKEKLLFVIYEASLLWIYILGGCGLFLFSKFEKYLETKNNIKEIEIKELDAGSKIKNLEYENKIQIPEIKNNFNELKLLIEDIKIFLDLNFLFLFKVIIIIILLFYLLLLLKKIFKNEKNK